MKSYSAQVLGLIAGVPLLALVVACAGNAASRPTAVPSASVQSTIPPAAAPGTPQVVRLSPTPSARPPAQTVVARPGVPGQISFTATGPVPASITIQAGRSVTFVNADSVSHHPLADDGTLFDAGTIAPGNSAVVQIAATGAHPWHDAGNSSLRGVITVLP